VRRRTLRGVLAAVLACLAVQPAAAAALQADARYKVVGPWAVSKGSGWAPSIWYGVTTYYPTNLGAGGYRHPILSWGNGTGNSCSTYDSMLRHYASWGLAVVCPNSGWTGSGNEIWASAQWMRGQNSASGSVFNGKLATSAIATAGGSQGASGAVNAAILSGSQVKSVAAVALVDPQWHIWGPVPSFGQVTAPVFLLSGANDALVSQSQQQTYYSQVPGAAAKAARKNADHNNINQTDFGLGYTTAWLKYTLERDATARAAFVGNPPEMNADTNYLNQAEKNLP
jgi:hypothetical protein